MLIFLEFVCAIANAKARTFISSISLGVGLRSMKIATLLYAGYFVFSPFACEVLSRRCLPLPLLTHPGVVQIEQGLIEP